MAAPFSWLLDHLPKHQDEHHDEHPHSERGHDSDETISSAAWSHIRRYLSDAAAL